MNSLVEAVFTDHARGQMRRRAIGEEDVRRTPVRADSVSPVNPRRVVAQWRLAMPLSGRVYLFWVFVGVDLDPQEIVTVYRTSRLGTYERLA